MALPGPVQVLVGYAIFLLLDGALVWNLYAEWLPDPSRAANPSCEKHLQFAMHSLLAMLLNGGVLTYLFSDIDWQDTPFTRHYGYNDITVVFDYPPSIYVMPACWFVTGAGFLLYGLEDTRRLLRQSEDHPGTTLSFVVNGALASAVLLFSLTLAVRAHQNITAHCLPALFLVMVLPLPFILQAFEGFWKRIELQRPDRAYGLLIIFVSWFSAVSLLKVGLKLVAVLARPVSPSLAKPVDGLWIFLALVVPLLLHPSPPGYQQLVGVGGSQGSQGPNASEAAGAGVGGAGSGQVPLLRSPQAGGMGASALAGKWAAGACGLLLLLAAAGLTYALCARNPSPPGWVQTQAQAAGLRSNSAVGFETLQRSVHCAAKGQDCHCPGGFVLFGRGQQRSYFRSGTPLARWDVFPERVEASLRCDPGKLGDPFVFSRSEECRCLQAGLACEQLAQPIARGCGTGSSADLIDMHASAAELECCSSHDRCYGLCGHTKQQCDQDFLTCLKPACSRSRDKSDCEELMVAMRHAIHEQSAAAEFSVAERSQQHWVLTKPGGASTSSPSHPVNTTVDKDDGDSGDNFDCHSGEEFWQMEWSERKKDWCCHHTGHGCEAAGHKPAVDLRSRHTTTSAPTSTPKPPPTQVPVPVPIPVPAPKPVSPPSSSSPSSSSSAPKSTTSKVTTQPRPNAPTPPPARAQAATTTAASTSGRTTPAAASTALPSKGSTANSQAQTTAAPARPSQRPGQSSPAVAPVQKPYNCLTTDIWPPDKTLWCCANLGLGCKPSERSPLRRLRERLAMPAVAVRG